MTQEDEKALDGHIDFLNTLLQYLIATEPESKRERQIIDLIRGNINLVNTYAEDE